VELLVAMALLAVMLPILYTGLIVTREGKSQEKQRLEAAALLQESKEAIRIIKDRGWTYVSTNGTYYPAISANTWSLATGTESINTYLRNITIGDVYRDASGSVVPSGGTLDPGSKKVTYTVSWTQPISNFVQGVEYLTRTAGNGETSQTTQATFDSGTKTNVVTTNTSGGEVVLAAGGKGDWCNPNLSIAAVDLPKNGVANAISAIEGQVVAGTGENASGVSFAKINVSDTDPPTSSIVGTFDGYKTNDVFNENGFSYLATDNNAKEVVILDTTTTDGNGKYPEVGYFNAPGNGSGDSVYVSGNIGYVTIANKLYTFNLTQKTGSRSQLAVKTLAGNGTEVVVNNGYAFVSIAGAALELQIVQATNNGATLTITGQADVNGQAAYDVSVNSTGSRAYLSTGVSSSLREFFIINTSSKSGNRPVIGSYETNGMDPNQSVIVTGNRAIIVGTGGEEYQVINISNEANPVRCGGLQINNGVNGIASVLEADGDAYSYIITGDGADELKIIQGGPGGQYQTEGYFESATVDAGATKLFNRAYVTLDRPGGSTEVAMQVAVANAVAGSCAGATFTYVGPNGDTNAWFTPDANDVINAIIPTGTYGSSYVNPGRCMRYKFHMTTSDINFTPVIYDVAVNYSL
jgi:hypothetical protein